MKMHRIGVLAVVAAGFAACAPGQADPLTGTWETADGGATLFFSEDGSFAASAPGGDTRGTYRRAEEEKLEMTFDGISTLVAVSIADDQLVFCPEGHGCERLQKVE